MTNTRKTRTKTGKRRSRSKRKSSTGRIYVAVIMLFMIGVMSFQIVKLYQKNEDYKAQEESLEKQVSDAKETQQELKDYEEYVGSDEYVEEQASEKLGLTHDNWIIFREKQD